MKIVRTTISDLTEEKQKSINEFIEKNCGLVFHEPDFNKIVSEFSGSQFNYLLAYDSYGEMIGICPVHTLKRGFLKFSYSNPTSFEVPYGGWVFNKNRTNIKELIKNMKLSPNESLTYCSNIQIHGDDYKNISNYHSIPRQTAVIDLSLREQTIWNDVIHSKRRNMIRKALKSGLKIKIFGPEGFDIYYKLMVDTHQRIGFKSMPKDYYFRIFDLYFKKKKAAIFIAEKSGQAIAGLVLIGNRNVMHYWQGASKGEVPNLGQGELLQWETIRWAKNNECCYYDLCIVEPKRLPNIAKFKLGFSRELIKTIEFVIKPVVFRMFNKLYKIFHLHNH